MSGTKGRNNIIQKAKCRTTCRTRSVARDRAQVVMARVAPAGTRVAGGRSRFARCRRAPDLVSGGDTLIAVKVPAGTRADQLTVTLNGKDVMARLTLDAATGDYRGLIDGLAIGTNRVTAKIKSPRHEATLTIVNHPITGPILSGPHLAPYECSTEASGLGPALDANCSAPRKIWHLYRSTDNTFKLLPDREGPRPADLATTTTTDGKTVPYIVRVDSGTINRAIYQIAMLDDPDGWNRKFVVSFGGSSGTQYIQGVMAPPPGGGVAQSPGIVEGIWLPDLVGARERPPRQRRPAGRDADDDQGIHHRALRRAEVLHRQRRIRRRDPAARDHADVSGIARRPDAEPHLPGFEPPHHRQHPADQPVAEARQERVDAGEDHRGRRLHARHRQGVERRVRTARRADQRRRLRAGRQDADLRSGHQSEGRALHDAGHPRQLSTAAIRRPDGRGARPTTSACSTASPRSTAAPSPSTNSSTSTRRSAAPTSTARSCRSGPKAIRSR